MKTKKEQFIYKTKKEHIIKMKEYCCQKNQNIKIKEAHW
jgi:hypothetical protein